MNLAYSFPFQGRWSPALSGMRLLRRWRGAGALAFLAAGKTEGKLRKDFSWKKPLETWSLLIRRRAEQPPPLSRCRGGKVSTLSRSRIRGVCAASLCSPPCQLCAQDASEVPPRGLLAKKREGAGLCPTFPGTSVGAERCCRICTVPGCTPLPPVLLQAPG